MFKKYKQRQYKVVAAFDTETCNYRKNFDYHAYTILYILNDFRNCDLTTYTPVSYTHLTLPTNREV